VRREEPTYDLRVELRSFIPSVYEYPGTHGKEYDLYTLGADNQPGGAGANADIGNWNVSD
jgi:hypothetical protein